MMLTPAPVVRSASGDDAAKLIAEFARRASFETTRPTPADIGLVKGLVSPGTQVYVSAIRSQSAEEQIEFAVRLRAAGLEPIPHLAARNFATAAELDRYLSRLRNEAQARRMLVIGGDRATPAGDFHRAIEIIDSGLLQSHGIDEVGLAGYPEGHPQVAESELIRTLAAKFEAAQQTGLAVHIVTQFAFSAAPILAWIGRLRDSGIDSPVKIGLAGPTSLAALMRYARICGVKSSAQGLARNAGLVKHALGATAPDSLLRALAEAAAGGRLGDVTPHFFSFGGLAATVRWVNAVAAGRISLDRAGGFSVYPS